MGLGSGKRLLPGVEAPHGYHNDDYRHTSHRIGGMAVHSEKAGRVEYFPACEAFITSLQKHPLIDFTEDESCTVEALPLRAEPTPRETRASTERNIE